MNGSTENTGTDESEEPGRPERWSTYPPRGGMLPLVRHIVADMIARTALPAGPGPGAESSRPLSSTLAWSAVPAGINASYEIAAANCGMRRHD